MKIALRTRNVYEILTKPRLVCLLSSLQSDEPNFTSLAQIFLELANLAVLFILQQTHTASSVHQLKNT